MAVNLASKYAKKVDERFKLRALTEAAVNHDYDWVGVATVTVYSVPTVSMNDYTVSGASRYGTAAELGNTKQDLTISKDRSFTFTIDRKNYQDTQMVMEAGKALARQIDEVIVPEVDTYRLAAMATAAASAGGINTTATEITAGNAYSSLLDASEYFGDNKVPQSKRICYCTNAFYKAIKMDNMFIKASDIGQKMLVNGQVGEVDGWKIVPVPSSYMPQNRDFICVHPAATVAAEKLEDYKTHDNPPGINGWLVEGRVRYDAFVLDSKNKAVYTHKNA